ncbi:hypothetical protein Lesp02_63380 [Lentzea sp. NBRC 105346]|uniref:hypothetical protein n=1 Tax=Lentzea sp. NBRC 105346 TaxID=3032205 RepID=UPI0024A25D28|nr:hypothetical protein [Lentzea sp. NBRC 105346]GLZ34151.1 hypothetical protein Lesp02_63380 [Lentzea sp. NBRC 105346]
MSEHRAVTTEDLAQQDRTQETPERDFPEQQSEFRSEEPEFRSESGTDEIPAQHEPDDSGTMRQDTPERTDSERIDSGRTDSEQRTPLFDREDTDRFRENWRSLQTDFVDDPQQAVRQADELVAEVMQTLASTFAEHKRSLEEQWSRGGEPQTEDLRLALQQYRVFFQQLLSV